MKKIIKLVVALTIVLAVLPVRNLMATSHETLKVAIVQLVSHPALDQITEGIKEGLVGKGYQEGKNLEIDFQNAEGDMSLLSNISELVVSKKPDVIFAVTTPVAQSLQQTTHEIPIILAGITDPVGAKLVDSLEKPGGNITGVSSAAPLEQQFDLMKEFPIKIERLGMVYTTSEDNSKAEVEAAKKLAEAAGMEVVIETVATASDVFDVAESLSSKVDAILVPSDNTIASSVDTFLDAADRAKIPVFPTFDDMVKKGGLASVAINQKGMGIQAAEIAYDILKGAPISEYAIQNAKDTDRVVNIKTATHLGIDIPKELLKQLTDLSGE